jgi:hypothetical protein
VNADAPATPPHIDPSAPVTTSQHRLVRATPGRVFALHVWALETAPGGTLLRTEESMTGWLPRLSPRMMQRTLESGVAATLDALAAAATR